MRASGKTAVAAGTCWTWCAQPTRCGPMGLEWPIKPEGGVSFKLGDLAAANGLLHESAHDALSDVRATIALARKLKDAQPRFLIFALACTAKTG